MSNGSVLDRFSLQGKTALVTGAGQGIGRAIAQTLANAGALVGCLDRNAESLHETVDLIQQAQGMALALVADVSSQAQTQAAVRSAGRGRGSFRPPPSQACRRCGAPSVRRPGTGLLQQRRCHLFLAQNFGQVHRGPAGQR